MIIVLIKKYTLNNIERISLGCPLLFIKNQYTAGYEYFRLRNVF